MGLLDQIKADVKKAGASKSEFLYFRDGQKVRVRFLADIDDGIAIEWHDSFATGINVPCGETFGRSCSACDDESLRTRTMYLWPVYNYESNKVQLFMFAVNNCSPIPPLVAMAENYGTLIDRDYVITQTGAGNSKSFAVVPMDKNKFRNTKVKAPSRSKMLAIVDKAYPSEDTDDDDVAERKTTKTKAKTKAAKARPQEEEDDDDEAEGYEDMTAKELYALCKERDIEALPRKTERYYIKLLEEYDQVEDDWGDDDDDGDDDADDWDDED